MSDATKDALALWGLGDARATFVTGRENRVYKVSHGGASYALRFKRPGYRDLAELNSEVEWLAAMGRAGLNVPCPRVSKNGKLIEDVGGSHVDLVTWLDGKPLGQTRAPLDLDDPAATFAAIGAEIARFHLACDAWVPPAGFIRLRWDAEGLLGENPVWGRFWENPTLDRSTRALFETFRAHARQKLDTLDPDFGLIHADFVRENVLIDGDTIRLIDFDDGGYGYRLFDVATALIKNLGEPDYDALKEALFQGYNSIRSLDMGQLDLFLALRAVTYVGWIVPRMGEQGPSARNIRFIEDANTLCGVYLNRSGAV